MLCKLKFSFELFTWDHQLGGSAPYNQAQKNTDIFTEATKSYV